MVLDSVFRIVRIKTRPTLKPIRIIPLLLSEKGKYFAQMEMRNQNLKYGSYLALEVSGETLLYSSITNNGQNLS